MVSSASSQETGVELAVFAQQWLFCAARGVENVVFAEALGAELAAVDRMIGITANCDGFVIFDADEHAAADGAVAAGGLNPGVGHARAGDVAEARIAVEGVVGLASVDAEGSANSFQHSVGASASEGERHVERNDGDEEEIARDDDGGEGGHGGKAKAAAKKESRPAAAARAKVTMTAARKFCGAEKAAVARSSKRLSD